MKRNNYGFIGLGLIGGSLAKSLKKKDPSCRICAYTRTRHTSHTALEQGFIDAVCETAHDRQFEACDYIFLCAPVGNNIEALEELKTVIRPNCILTDVGSVKTGIHEAVSRLGLTGQFIGGHPMTGSEKTGFENATDHLFENAYYILTPTPEVPRNRVEEYYSLAASFGAIPLVISYQEHDYITAAVSHLPHVIAAALVNTVHNLDNREEHMKLIAAGGFKDITRIASSSPEMWEQICVSNQKNIARVMDEFIRLLAAAREQMRAGDGAGIYRMFEESRDYRDSFSSASLGAIKKTYRIYCDIIDESGAIATIATTLAVTGISIKNIGIVHNREFEEGALCIEFYDEATSLRAAQILRQHRYQVWET
ncbi:MAG TPA: prephenate dehydrogenase [Candidatus Merdiplasma excrementigallinarum]|uniref:Prephenate dehydrogenase n=1 Tax=Candidatus Merdiplasma excrementigallinarum TaxID=2840864 RepID=A0A9D1P008_9FIRM|nr:prephenate dehydrogenase [Candidatus Merdiplasma excrementigallinarum]